MPYLKSLDNGILISNVIACAIMGYLLAIPNYNPTIKMGIISLCGGLSTFSGYIAFSFISTSGTANSMIYHIISIGLGLLFFTGSYYGFKSLLA